MATRLKTIEYVFETNIASRASAVRLDFTAITAHIPEASGVVSFKSVVVKVFQADDATAAQSLTNWLIGIKLGAVAFSDATVTDTITNSGEAQTYIFTRDVTSYFSANWSGTSMAMQVGVSNAGGVTQNTSAKVLITYEYDDTQATHVKTIRIPLESTRAALTASYQTIGGATALPAFKGSYLPESGVSVKQVWIEFWGNVGLTTVATDFTVTARIDGTNTKVIWDNESALVSGTWAFAIYDVTAETLTSAVSIEALSSFATSMKQLGGIICCTYTYDETNTTTVFNSILVGAYDSVGSVGGTTEAYKDTWSRSIFIQEPNTITMKESGVCMFGMDNASPSITTGVGAQTPRSYATMGSTMMCGQYSWVHRIDADGQVGTAGMTLTRGRNTFTINLYTTIANQGWNLAGFLILNYTSGKASGGTGAHAHSVRHHIANTAADDPVRYHNATAPAIPETNYWLNSVIVEANCIVKNSTAQFIGLNAEKLAGEGEGSGWENLYGGSSIPDNENNLQTIWGAARKAWQRWNGDLDTDRMNIETARRYKSDMALTAWSDLAIWFTYHTITYTVSGTISESNGGTVNLKLFRDATGEAVLATSRSGNGAYSFAWFDDTEDVYVDAYEDSTHVFRSNKGKAS